MSISPDPPAQQTAAAQPPDGSPAPRSRTIAHLMDNAIAVPGTKLRFGIDPILGLVPGIGDVLGAGFGLAILYDAARCKVRRWTQVRIALNVLINGVFGAIPVVGDLFSLSFKSNARNYNLLASDLAERGIEFSAKELEQPGFPWFAASLIGLVLLVMGALGLGLIWLLQRLFS